MVCREITLYYFIWYICFQKEQFYGTKKHISLLSSRGLRTEQDLFPGCQRRGWSQDKQRIPRLTNTIGSHILGNWIVIAVRQSIWGPRRINMYVFFHYPFQTAPKPKFYIYLITLICAIVMYQTTSYKISFIAKSCDTGGENTNYTGLQFERGLNPSAEVSACPSWQQ